MEDGQRVVAVHPLVPGRVDLDAVVEAEEARHPVAIPQERVEGREQGRPARWRGRSPCPGEGGKVAREGEPAARPAFDLERRHLATLDHRAERGAARTRPEAREGQVVGQVQLRRRAHGVQRALDVPALEVLGRDRRAAERVGDRALQEVEALLEVLPRMNGQRAGHPQVVQRMLNGPPAPPPGGARGAAALEISLGHRAIGEHGRLHPVQHLRVPAEPPGPAGVAESVVEHGASPPGQHGGRDEAGGVGPVLEEEAAPIDDPVEPRAIVGAEAAPHGEVVGALEHVDRVELETAHVLDEAGEPVCGEGQRARPREVLTLEKERGHRAQRNGRAGHPDRESTTAERRHLR